VGERPREGNDLIVEMDEAGVFDKTALVFGQMDEPPGTRLRGGPSPPAASFQPAGELLMTVELVTTSSPEIVEATERGIPPLPRPAPQATVLFRVEGSFSTNHRAHT